MELRHLRYFLAVADERNFTRAAEKLGIAQPPLSQQIRSLEEELGVQLFHRVPHGAELTVAGVAFLAEARLSLAAAERAKSAAARAHRGETGSLLIGFTTSAALNPIISSTIDRFHHDWPEVVLSLEEMTTSALLQRMMRGDLDIAFVRPSLEAPHGINFKPLADEAMVIALPANHRLARRQRLRLEDLAAEPFVMFAREFAPSLYDEIFSACQGVGFVPRLRQETHRVTSTVHFVAAHFGVAIVPTSITHIELPGVIYRGIDGPAPVARLALATPSVSRSPIGRNFVALLP